MRAWRSSMLRGASIVSWYVVVPAAVAAALSFAHPAHAASDADLEAIRAEVRQLKQVYESRIGALEARLKDAEARAAQAAVSASAGAAPATAAASPPLAAQAPATYPAAAIPAGATGAAPASGLAAFNPAISVVLQGTYANLSQDPNTFGIAGFQAADETGPGRRGLRLSESEIGISANVDDKFAANLVVALSPENTVSVEEAYGYMPSLANGVVPKFGRFFSGIGYLNEQHQHAWDFVDAPLAYQAFLGGQIANDGLQVKWVAPTETFIELGAEIGNGDSFPGSPRERNGAGAYALYAHTGGDIGDSHSWRAGVSWLGTRADRREALQPDATGTLADTAFTGRSRTAIADFIWKYAPHGNATQTNLKLQGEYFWRRERGELTYDADGELGLTQADRYAASQRGWYVQGIYQFMPYWRVGARYDRLDPGRSYYGANADLLDIDFRPQRATLMLDYSPSEFSRFRLQYGESRTRPGFSDRELFLQYILTLGAHGAHKF
jgi:hypothetical protein